MKKAKFPFFLSVVEFHSSASNREKMPKRMAGNLFYNLFWGFSKFFSYFCISKNNDIE